MQNRIKSLRLENDLSQRALAERIGCSQKSIDGWEKGLNEPSAGFICALADCFSCTTDYLLGREDDFGNVNINPESAEQYREILQAYISLPKEKQEFIYDLTVFFSSYKR